MSKILGIRLSEYGGGVSIAEYDVAKAPGF